MCANAGEWQHSDREPEYSNASREKRELLLATLGIAGIVITARLVHRVVHRNLRAGLPWPVVAKMLEIYLELVDSDSELSDDEQLVFNLTCSSAHFCQILFTVFQLLDASPTVNLTFRVHVEVSCGY